MFPIRNISGKTIAFGGRTLKTDKKIAKYFNSPEHALYNKSKVLYGIYEAKNAMVKEDLCYLVEGYTDVIAMHQAGVENVVASSGTALTDGQIKLIKRYTKNITMLYDGDPAGIKASFRGIDLILAQGMNVKVVLFPDGDDPDSYSKKVSSTELQAYIRAAAKDFLNFKTDLLLDEAAGDPIKRAQLIRDVVESIAKIPDAIQRSVYLQASSSQLEVDERVLVSELNKLLRADLKKQGTPPPIAEANTPSLPPPEQDVQKGYQTTHQEKDLIRLLLHYGNYGVKVHVLNENNEKADAQVSVAEYLCAELEEDRFTLQNEVFQEIVDTYRVHIDDGKFPATNAFSHHSNPKVAEATADLLAERYVLSDNWEDRHQIYPETEDMKLDKAVRDCINRFKLSNVMVMIQDLEEELKNCNDDDLMILLDKKRKLDQVKRQLSTYFGTSVL